MLKHARHFIIFLAFSLVSLRVPGQAAPRPEAKPDYSKEAFVVEQSSTRIIFENDGTGTRESSTRIRIQSDAGVQHYGLLTFSYQNLVEIVDIDYVRVRKPDGTIVLTPAENTQDMAAAITREAPFYSDLREKHVAVKGLGVGDVLEFRAKWQSTKPLAPGQFWYAYNFSRDGIILVEELQISVPHDRAVKWNSTQLKPAITEENGRHVFTWTNSQLEHASSEQEKKDQEEKMYQLVRGKLPPPEVQISTFQSWDEVGRWYGSLQQERIKPNDEIRAKAVELTKNANDDNAKVRAIYKYVSTEFRYIGVAFGIGRYQPHTAAEVLANQYGDCKDKHTLLASLLDAVGIKAYPALINSSRELDLDVPSPAQFDHVISAVTQGNTLIWLDTTSEVAPYGYLLSSLRDKQALMIPPDKPPVLVTTPSDAPAHSVLSFSMTAKLSDTGTLEGKVEQQSTEMDAEVLLRLAFRRIPQPQWKDLVQQISYASGFAGDVSEVTASLPEKTDEPFRISYNYSRKDFPDWANRRIAEALPPFNMPTVDTKTEHPIWLGPPQDFHYQSSITLPKGYSAEIPASVDLKEDFAEYHASYTAKEDVLNGDRRLVVKLSQVPEKEYEAYKKFSKAVGDDYDRYISLSFRQIKATHSYQDEIWELPYSDNSEAAQAYDHAREEYLKHDPQAEIAFLQHAVEVDPKFTRAWLWLGEIYKSVRQPDAALKAYRRAIDIDQQPVSYKALGFALMRMGKYEDALSVWQELIKAAPGSVDGPSELARTFFNLKRYAEAASALESAVKIEPHSPDLSRRLGTAYLRSGDNEKALAIYKKAFELDTSPLMLNDIGYELADTNKNLPQALEYAEKAVHQEEEASQKVKLSDLDPKDLKNTSSLGAYWDTLGWVYFRMGNLDQAEKYIDAAWILSQSWEQANHLGQIYERRHKKDGAVRMYRLSLAAIPERLGEADSTKELRARLEHLDPGSAESESSMNFKEQLGLMRTTKLTQVTSGTASAEFFLVFGPGSKVEDTKFISGSDKLQSAGAVLRSIPFKVLFPDGSQARLVRRGILNCSTITGCSFVFLTPDSVHSVN
jgi:tetratricopeptide (TPR) repeat protein